jgi:hypothetical protein
MARPESAVATDEHLRSLHTVTTIGRIGTAASGGTIAQLLGPAVLAALGG